ncbi:uncharacterized protein LOC143586237 [Bidens hawaiensis]|uniref:uncharacterized protein LOC143586237 n=1 Tax=Bidens hawaiensis TaxID=980011 RepID=UPI00404B3343
MVRDCFEENPQLDLKLRIIGTRQHDARQYNLPSSSEVASLIFGDIGDAVDNRDIIVTKQSGSLKRISELHPSYTPLQYPLFHPFGEDGYQVNILHKNVSSSLTTAHKKVTMREFSAYHIQDRPNMFSTMLNGRRLFQQILVDKYTMIEAQRLHFIRCKQHELRCDTYQILRGMQSVGNTDVSIAGQRVILPSSFTGGARYMMQNYLDAMCLCRWFGYPDFFITITCNPNWPEVKRLLKDTTLKSEDRPDILCRIFKVKLDAMIKLVKDKSLFGKVQAGLILNEEQLKNLPFLEIETFLISNNSSLRRYKQMSFPDMETISRATNPLMVEELSYDTETMNNEFNNMFDSLTDEQRGVYNEIMSALIDKKGGVKGNTDVYELLKNTSLIIWDEAPMIHKHAFESLDRTLNDVMNGDSGNTSESRFGGKVVIFGGDFRQILPVVTNGTRSECVNACINSSYIWSKCKVLKLTKNMRLTVGCRSTDVENIREFADWLLDIGQGNVGGPNDGQSVIDIPDDLLILNSVDSMGDLISFDRALLAPLNEVVQEINERMLAIFPGEEVEYLSSDSLAECEDVSEDFDPQLYSPDLLNGLKISRMPNHRLVLKVGVPIMLLRNINHKKGLCNGTRLQDVSLGRCVIEAKVVSGTNIGYQTLISRVSLTPTDKKLPFRLKRRQFPISVCFAMIINKSQGQSLSRVGLYLKDPVFSHCQLYVALSRVKSRDGIKLLILDKESKLTNKTTNVIYKEIFGNVE